MSRQYFQNPTFSRVGKLFQDIPVEALTQAATGMNDAYSKNLQDFNKLEMAYSALKGMDGDQAMKQQKLQAMQESMQGFASKGGFENADAFIGSQTAAFLGDQDLTAMQENYALQQEDEKIGRTLTAQGITPVDARSMYNGENFQSVTTDEFGNKKHNTYRGGYMKPGDYDATQTTIFNDLKPETYTRHQVNPNGDGSLISTRTFGISEKRIREYATKEGMNRYKNTDAYRTQLIHLQTQGVTGQEAEDLIQSQLVSNGLERENMSSASSIQGYVNPNVLAARRAAQQQQQPTQHQFVQKASTVSKPGSYSAIAEREDKGWISRGGPFAVLADTVADWWNKKDLNIPTNGESTFPVNGEEQSMVFQAGNYFKVGPVSDSSSRRQEADITDVNVKQLPYTQIFMSADGNDMVQLGGGSSWESGRQIEGNAQPYMKNGSYYFTDKDGQPVPVKPVNVAAYTDQEGNNYYQPLGKIMDSRVNGSGAINQQEIEMSAPINGGDSRFVDSYDARSVDGQVKDIYSDPSSRSLASQQIEIELSSLNIDDPSVNSIVRKIYGGGNEPILALRQIVREGIIEVPSENGMTHTINAEGATGAKILNAVLKSNFQRNLPGLDLKKDELQNSDSPALFNGWTDED